MSVIRTCVSVIRTCVSLIRTCVSVIRTCVSLIRTSSGVEKNVLITDTFLLRMDRNGSQAMVLITGVLITGTLLIQNYRKKIGYQEKWFL